MPHKIKILRDQLRLINDLIQKGVFKKHSSAKIKDNIVRMNKFPFLQKGGGSPSIGGFVNQVILELVDINATFLYRAKIYFTYIKSLLWLIAVPTMNNISLCSSDILYRNKHKSLEKYWHNYSNLA